MCRIISSLLCLLIGLGPLAAQVPDLERVTLTSAAGHRIEAEKGQLRVPEHRADPQAGEIPINFVRLKSTAARPAAPVFYLEGGPGSSCTWQADVPGALDRWVPRLAVADVFLIDQRGTGPAARNRMTYLHTDPLPEDLFVTEQAAVRHFTGMAPRALATWAERGIPLGGYNTHESAKDLDALRKAYGLERISLLGFSYGTHLGQAYLKYFGDHLERVILVGVEGLGETFKLPLRLDAQFRKLAALVAADPEISRDVPDLLALYDRVAGKLAADPVSLTVTSPLTRQPLAVRLGKFGLDHILLRDLGDASDLPVIPRLLYDIDRGDYSALTWFLQKRVAAGYGIHAMAAATDIASGGSPERLAQIRRQARQSRFGNVVNTPFLALRDVLGVPDLGESFRADFTSPVPVLLLSGTLDLNTPPYQAERLRWSLPNATHIVVGNAGHEQILTHPAIGEAMLRFLGGEDVSGVTAAYPPLRFLPVRGSRPGVGHPAVGEE